MKESELLELTDDILGGLKDLEELTFKIQRCAYRDLKFPSIANLGVGLEKLRRRLYRAELAAYNVRTLVLEGEENVLEESKSKKD